MSTTSKFLIPIVTSAVFLLGAQAQAATFLYTNSPADYSVDQSGYYSFIVAGAQGGTDEGVGGGGAMISGKIYFASGTDLSVLVGAGGQDGGGNSAAGGGGMSFIAEGDTPIVVAGGGAGTYWSPGFVGGDGQIGTAIGGTPGQGGVGPASGAGWYSDGGGGIAPDEIYGGGGHSSPSYAGGNPNVGSTFVSPGGAGGFGGGGGGGYSCGGAGGGYSGGSLGGDLFCTAGGGGSFISPLAFDVVALGGANKAPFWCLESASLCISGGESGFVDLIFAGVPEPSTWALLIFGFGITGTMLRQLRSRGIT